MEPPFIVLLFSTNQSPERHRIPALDGSGETGLEGSDEPIRSAAETGPPERF